MIMKVIPIHKSNSIENMTQLNRNKPLTTLVLIILILFSYSCTSKRYPEEQSVYEEYPKVREVEIDSNMENILVDSFFIHKVQGVYFNIPYDSLFIDVKNNGDINLDIPPITSHTTFAYSVPVSLYDSVMNGNKVFIDKREMQFIYNNNYEHMEANEFTLKQFQTKYQSSFLQENWDTARELASTEIDPDAPVTFAVSKFHKNHIAIGLLFNINNKRKICYINTFLINHKLISMYNRYEYKNLEYFKKTKKLNEIEAKKIISINY